MRQNYLTGTAATRNRNFLFRKFVFWPGILDILAIRQGTYALIPEFFQQAVRGTFPIKYDDKPMKERVVL